MLRIRPLTSSEDTTPLLVLPNCTLAGLHEDTDYVLDVGSPGAEVFVDDVALERLGPTSFRWRPEFYSGRVIAEVVRVDLTLQRYSLDVSPSRAKSGQDEFDAMVAAIRAFDETMLGGLSSASMAFGREGRPGMYELDVLLSRLRQYGLLFLEATESISRAPHRFLDANVQVLPLSRVRKLHQSALRDRRVVALASGFVSPTESIDSLQISGLTSAPTFNTPANRALKALLQRFQAAIVALEDALVQGKLGSPPDEQRLRLSRRQQDLDSLARRTRSLLHGPLFREVSAAETSSAGLTQIAAQPGYSKAYRLGCRALATQVEGDDGGDALHVPPSWGIYETWCYLCVVNCIEQGVGHAATEAPPRTVAADRAFRVDLPNGEQLEVLFQAVFPSLRASSGRSGWSISRQRRPDIVLVHRQASGMRTFVLDAKWRSGRENVLAAMASAHIYHDALRVGAARPQSCVLLLPGAPDIHELEDRAYLETHGLGALSEVRVGAAGVSCLRDMLLLWLLRDLSM